MPTEGQLQKPSEDRLQKKDIADLLFKKYSLLKSEIHLQMASYKRHARSVQVVATALFAAVSYLIVDGKFAPSNQNMIVWTMGLFVAIALLCYFVLDILDSAYDICILGERMASLEKQINDIAETKLFIWESEISEAIHNPIMPLPGVLPPYVGLQGYMWFLLAVVLVIFPNAIAYYLWTTPISHLVFFNRSLTVIDSLFSVLSAAFLMFVAHGVLKGVRPGFRDLIRKKLSEKWRRDESATTKRPQS